MNDSYGEEKRANQRVGDLSTRGGTALERRADRGLS